MAFRYRHRSPVIGFDDVLITNYLQPHLTTIRYPVIEMATNAVRLADWL